MSSREKTEEGRKNHAASAVALLILFSMIAASLACFSLNSDPSIDQPNVPVRTMATPGQNGTTVFHLHWDGTLNPGDRSDAMNTSGPYSPAVIDYDNDARWGVSMQRQHPFHYHVFVMYPLSNAPLHILGDAVFNFWARSDINNSAMDIEVSLYDSADTIYGADTLIATNFTIGITFLANEQLFTFNLTSIDYTMPVGHSLILYIGREDADKAYLYLAFDQSFLDSILAIDIPSNFYITDAWSQGLDSVRRTIFSDQDSVLAYANVSDAIGAYDIRNASLKVFNVSNEQTVQYSEMLIDRTDTSTAAAWKLFKSSIGPFAVGNYSVNVTAYDLSGSAVKTDWNIRIITVDHFDVSLSRTRVAAGTPFNVTIEAKNSDESRMTEWSGWVAITAINESSGLPIAGLPNTTAFMPSSVNGIINVTENFTIAPIDIRIRASNGSASGTSQIIQIAPGQIVSISLNRTSLLLMAGENASISAIALDMFGNVNSTWQPFWYLQDPNGSLIASGTNAYLTATVVGFTALFCKDNASGINEEVFINITVSRLVRIDVIAYASTVWEGYGTTINATGYDAYNNVVDITGAIWSATGFAMSSLTGSGGNGQFHASMSPESGTIHVTHSGVSGQTSISVITPPWGPRLGTLPNQIGYEDTPWSLDLANYWQDTNGTEGLTWYVTGVNDSLLLISHDPQSNSKVNFIPQPNANGENTVLFWVTDPTGYTNNKQILITVIAVNDAPMFVNDPPTLLYVKFNLPYSFNYSYYIEDVDDNTSQLSLTVDKTDGVTSNGLVLTYNYPDKGGGNPYNVILTLTVSDGSLSDSLTIEIRVTSDTPPDLVKPLPDVTIMEGDMNVPVFDLDEYFTDIDGDVLFYSTGYEHIQISINQTTHIVSLSSPSEWSGQTNAVIIANDTTGAIRIDTIVVTVQPVNDAPSIDQIDRIFVHYNMSYWLDLRMYVHDPDNDFSELTITTTEPLYAMYEALPYPHLVLLYPARLGGGAYNGPYDVHPVLSVSDIEPLTDSITLNITVSDNIPPSIPDGSPEYVSFLEDSYLRSINLKMIFSDDDINSLVFSCTGNSSVIVNIDSDGWVNLSALPNWNGNETLIFKATDSQGAWMAFMVRVVVIPVNDPPILSQISDQIHYGGRQWSVNIKSFIADVDDPELKHIEIIIVQPEYVKAVGFVLYFDLPENVNSATVIIYVSDGESNSETVTFKAESATSFLDQIGYPWSLLIVMIVAGIIGYIIAMNRLPHKLEDLFLIHNDGRLICHVGTESEKGMDEDVVSAMFTAVQEFIKDSFKDAPEGLKKLEMGEKKIVIEKGKWIYAAMIYSGWPPKNVFKTFGNFVNDVESAYGTTIEHWDGTMKKLFGIQAVSQAMLDKKYHSTDAAELMKKPEAPTAKPEKDQ